MASGTKGLLKTEAVVVREPALVYRLTSTTSFAWLWLLLRVYLGYTWLKSGLPKLSNPAWMETGEALKGYWARAVTTLEPRPVVAYDWYRNFLATLLEGGHHVWFAKLVVYGEVLVGVGLILGALTGFAAFFGGLMNWNFMMAGSASTNPLMFAIAVLLMLGWRVAGYYGVDRWLLPALGTPWGKVEMKPLDEGILLPAGGG